MADFLSVDINTDVDDAAKPKSKSSKRVANPCSDDDLGDRVVDECTRSFRRKDVGSDKLISSNYTPATRVLLMGRIWIMMMVTLLYLSNSNSTLRIVLY